MLLAWRALHPSVVAADISECVQATQLEALAEEGLVVCKSGLTPKQVSQSVWTAFAPAPENACLCAPCASLSCSRFTDRDSFQFLFYRGPILNVALIRDYCTD